MPSFQDSAVIFFLALLLFGPKKLPELARQLGKLMGEFRRASNEFRIQMEDELRASEQAERQKQIAAIEAAAPARPVVTSEDPNALPAPHTEGADQPAVQVYEDPLDSHPHMQPPDRHAMPFPETPESSKPLPIATSGDLNLMPPATGLPVARSAPVSEASVLSPVFDSIPEAHETNGASHTQGQHDVSASVSSDQPVTHG